MRSADGPDACRALSTACPNAARGRVAAAPAIAAVARNVRRPVLDFISSPYLISKMYSPRAVSRSGARVNRSRRHERHFRCRQSVEDQLDGVADVAVGGTWRPGHHQPRGGPAVLPGGCARDGAQAIKRLGGQSTGSGRLHLYQDRTHRWVARALLHVGDIGPVRLKHPGVGLDEPPGRAPLRDDAIALGVGDADQIVSMRMQRVCCLSHDTFQTATTSFSRSSVVPGLGKGGGNCEVWPATVATSKSTFSHLIGLPLLRSLLQPVSGRGRYYTGRLNHS